MFCSKCGKQLNYGAAFCDGCGAAVNKSSQPESAGVQRAKAVSNEKILIERSQKNKAMTVIAIVSSLELLFLCLAGATKLSFFDFMFNSTGNSLLEYILDKSGGVLSFFGFMEGCCCLAEIIMCFVFYKKREFSTYKKFKL
ncbi:MAG: hypothetical protein K2G32_09735, partial [Oscillospiraceae bacterium]|nr:hypothetical protein [Oscillospiraceae bacterium]